ncbi:hypothetical protein B0T25DRAFT_86337 [Lasiosphaeria hispida]|uniref:Uncharacterized protein n=1 Tax=Lasiosphaeria hispida TaxID=260671 RepID=A0AAJ0HQ09_9PEZI|nr:hypothetical protein B0T25DRAFT_86337 [Lasiosphaeria hispida]
MGVEGKKKSIPLPAPTETESNVTGAPTELGTDLGTELGTDLGTDVSRPGDDKSSYSIPEDGTPVTIKTGHRASKSQTSLLIEYFEGGKGSETGSSERKPSVRVRLTPSSKHKSRSGSDRDRIEITQGKSTRKVSLSRRSAPSSAKTTRSEGGQTLSALSGDVEDASSYASATEESNVSRNPIDIEIDRGGSRRRRPASPLIPAADGSKASYMPPPTMSEISGIPTDSFLDGSGPATSFGMSEIKSSRSRSPPRGGDYVAGGAAGMAAAALTDRLRNKSRSEVRDRDRDRVSVSKTRDKDKDRDRERERRHKSSKSRTSSLTKEEKNSERTSSPRRKSSGRHSDSLISGADSSVLSSALSPTHRSMDNQSIRSTNSKASSINNPKLLETVEDAIRRLILPELNALKREQSKHKDRRGSASSATTVSREDYASDRRRSSGTDKNTVTPRDSVKSRERRDREARNDFDDSPSQSAVSHESVEESRHIDDTPMRSTDRLKLAAAGAGLGAAGAAAYAAHEALKSPSDDKRSRRRRRAEMRSRASDQAPEPEDEDSQLAVPTMPVMPLMSEINPSEVTRASILSADSDRPHSASEELTPGRELQRGQLSRESTPTPTLASATLQALGTQHANISHGDLKALPRQRTSGMEEYEPDEYGQKVPMQQRDYEEEDEEQYDEPSSDYPQPGSFDYYSTQDVPPPLKYVPYQPERRGLSPIPSVSGYTEGGSEAPNRDSRLTHPDSLSSPEKSPHIARSLRSPSSIPSNIIGREFGDDDRSLRSSGMDQANIMGAADSELEGVASGQAVRAVAMNPAFVHPAAIESNVASLVDGSMLDGSVLTTDSSALGNQHYNGRESMATLEEEKSRIHDTPTKRSVGSHREYEDGRGDTPVSASQRSREFVEYDIDEYGRKIAPATYRQSPTTSETAITNAAVKAAATVLRAQHSSKGNQQQVMEDDREVYHTTGMSAFESAGIQRNQSFKERTKNGPRPGMEPKQSIDRLADQHEPPKLGFNSLPDPNDPLPDLEGWQDDDLVTNPSLLDGHHGGQEDEEHWAGDATPRQRAQHHLDEDDLQYDQLDGARASPSVHQTGSGHGLGITEGAVAAAAIGAAAAMAANQHHSQQPSQEQEEEWYRTSDDRKRDTLVTNPYEGASPVVNLTGMDDMGPMEYENAEYVNNLNNSPMGHKDEGYISQGPNKTPDVHNDKGKGPQVDFNLQHGIGGATDDPFYSTPKHTRHLSGMSQGMGSPLYDASTGMGIDRIESKDIIALMQHLMVRDAQRSARDTEILFTLVRAATEMRTNFEDIKRMLADTEDVIITEVKDNTDKSIQRAINGPRPFPGSGARSLQAPSQAGTDDANAKKRSIFRRALKGLGAKGANDLGRIEDMLMQLLTEVDVLKAQTAPGTVSGIHQDEQLYDHIQPEIQYEQDHGYEPEGNAGTSTASQPSQSGHLSVQSRGASTKPGFDRRQSAHRISTVPEDNEDEYDDEDGNESVQYGKADVLMTPAQDQRGSSVPLATPPGAMGQTQTSASNENTPRTEEGKKKSGTRSSWFPKISRWSETTTSSVAQVFRRSGQSNKNDDERESNFQSNSNHNSNDERKYHSAPSRSGSLGSYSDNFQFSNPHPVQTDKLHTGFSEQNLGYNEADPDSADDDDDEELQPPGPIPGYVSMTPEDPKYKAHRNSLNLQHPQPRQGQTERFKVALESQALGFGSPLSPKSADWQGSVTSLNRFPAGNRDSYGSATDQYQQHWTSSPAAANMTATAGPPRPPKEPMDHTVSPGPIRGTPPQNKRLSKLQKQSPLPHHSVESGYGTMTQGVPTASYISHSRDGGSPRLENRNLSGALGVSRRPSGPRPMTPKSVGSAASDDGRNSEDVKRKRGR